MVDNNINRLQREPVGGSFFWPVTGAGKFLFGMILLGCGSGLICLILCIITWSYQASSFRHYRQVNASLKKELSAAEGKQQQLLTEFMQINQAEEYLRMSCGLQNDRSSHRFATGGKTSPDDMFINSSDPLYKRYSLINRSTEILSHNLALAANHFKELQTYLQYQAHLRAHTPVVAPASGQLSSQFGYRVHPFSGRRSFHFGVDIAAKKWTEVYASADGKVGSTRYNASLGKIICIDHENGYVTVYAHLAKRTVEKGQLVKRYDLIGYMGSSGLTTGTHLHYEVHRDQIPRNPVNHILPEGVMVD
ncbi:M23 family metallopeptidase [Fibrobacterota bacterium]